MTGSDDFFCGATHVDVDAVWVDFLFYDFGCFCELFGVFAEDLYKVGAFDLFELD